jgi:ATP-binding cassette subfamily B protein
MPAMTRSFGRNPGPPVAVLPGVPERPIGATLRSLLPFLWPRDSLATRVRVVVAVCLLIAAKGATVLVPLLYARAVDALAPRLGVAAVPLGLILGYGLLRLAGQGFGELRDGVFAAVQQRTVRRVALSTFRHLHQLSLRFHLDRQTGALSRAIDRGTAGIETVLRLSVFSVVPTAAEVLFVTVLLWRLFDWRYAALTVLAIGLFVAFTLVCTGWRVRIRRRMNEADNLAKNKALDSLLNYETVKYFGAEAHEAARFDAAMADYERAAVRGQVTLSMLNFGQAAIVAAALVAMMLLAASGVAAGEFSVGRFVLVNTYLMQLVVPLNMFGFVYREIRQGLVDMEQLFRLLDVPPEVAERPGALTLGETAGTVTFEHVRFAYKDGETVLRDLCFELPAGRTLALVGASGAGKSTITRLLFRFYDPQVGRVLIDGHDLRDLRLSSLRAAIGVVPQDPVLFNDSIRYNIAYGRVGASAAEVERAARAARLDTLIARLPQGFDTLVGERGVKLSGGERQRLALARVLLKRPRILVLDEATSALDSHTEQEVLQTLRAAAPGRSTLVIAHRLSSVVDADRIVVLAEGKVVESGTHAALLAAGGTYAELWRVQQQRARRPVPAA